MNILNESLNLFLNLSLAIAALITHTIIHVFMLHRLISETQYAAIIQYVFDICAAHEITPRLLSVGSTPRNCQQGPDQEISNVFNLTNHTVYANIDRDAC